MRTVTGLLVHLQVSVPPAKPGEPFLTPLSTIGLILIAILVLPRLWGGSIDSFGRLRAHPEGLGVSQKSVSVNLAVNGAAACVQPRGGGADVPLTGLERAPERIALGA